MSGRESLIARGFFFKGNRWFKVVKQTAVGSEGRAVLRDSGGVGVVSWL